MIYVRGEDQLLAAGSDYVAGQAFPIEHEVAVHAIFRGEGSGFREDVAGAGICGLDFCKRTVFAKNRQRFEENGIIGARRPVGEIAAHKIWTEKVGPVAASAIAL